MSSHPDRQGTYRLPLRRKCQTWVMSTDEPTLDDGYGQLAQTVAQFLPRSMQLAADANSEMAADNDYLAPHKHLFSQLVQHRLLSVLDHLQLVAAARSDSGDVHAFAQSSLIRSAILGGCTTIWLMTGSAQQRRMNALKLIYKDCDEFRKYLDAGAREPKFGQSLNQFLETAAEMRTRSQAAFDAAQELQPGLLFKAFTTISDTDIVIAAGKALDPAGFDDWDIAVSLERQWRMLSGYVHSYPWATRPDWKELERSADGTVRYQITGDPERILDSAFIAANVAEQALIRFTKLATR